MAALLERLVQDVARKGGLARARDPVTATSRPSGMHTSMFLRLWRLAFWISNALGLLATVLRGCTGCLRGSLRNRPVIEAGFAISSSASPCGDHGAAELARARPEIHHVLCAPDRVLVVLDHHERVALGLELLEHVEQDAVVAVVQADGRLVEDVAHAAQVGAARRERMRCASPPESVGAERSSVR